MTNKSNLKLIDGIHLIMSTNESEHLFEKYPIPLENINLLWLDKSLLLQTEPIRQLFEYSDFVYRRGIIAHFLSHMSLWLHIASTNNELHLILEDQAKLPENFVSEWNNKYALAMPSTTKLLYLGGSLEENNIAYNPDGVLQAVNRAFYKHRPTSYFSHEYLENYEFVERGEKSKKWIYRGFSYVISSDAANILIKFINNKGVRSDIDHLLNRLLDYYDDVYATSPLLITQKQDKTLNLIRQNDFTVIPLPSWYPKAMHSKFAQKWSAVMIVF